MHYPFKNGSSDALLTPFPQLSVFVINISNLENHSADHKYFLN